MEKALQLDIVTPDKVVFSDQVQYVGARGVEGEFGVLPGHFQLLAALDIGCLRYTNLEGDKKCAFVGGGFAEVLDDKVTILAESSELAEDIDQARAMQARERAEKRLEHRTEEIDADRAQAALHRAITRIGVYSEIH